MKTSNIIWYFISDSWLICHSTRL